MIIILINLDSFGLFRPIYRDLNLFDFIYLSRFTIEDSMIQHTAFKALLEHKGQLGLLGLTCLIESLSIVGQAWFFGTLINNLIFLEHTLADEMNTIIYLFVAIVMRWCTLRSRGSGKSLGECCRSIL